MKERFNISLGVSALTFIVYRADKSAAVAGEQRVPESALHLLGQATPFAGKLVLGERGLGGNDADGDRTIV